MVSCGHHSQLGQGVNVWKRDLSAWFRRPVSFGSGVESQGLGNSLLASGFWQVFVHVSAAAEDPINLCRDRWLEILFHRKVELIGSQARDNF